MGTEQSSVCPSFVTTKASYRNRPSGAAHFPTFLSRGFYKKSQNEFSDLQSCLHSQSFIKQDKTTSNKVKRYLMWSLNSSIFLANSHPQQPMQIIFEMLTQTKQTVSVLILLAVMACHFVRLCTAHRAARVVLNSAESRIINKGEFESL